MLRSNFIYNELSCELLQLWFYKLAESKSTQTWHVESAFQPIPLNKEKTDNSSIFMCLENMGGSGAHLHWFWKIITTFF